MLSCSVSRVRLCNLMDCSLPGSSVQRHSPGKNTRVDCHALLQGIFPTEGSNPGLLHCRQILYQLSYQGSPKTGTGEAQIHRGLEGVVLFLSLCLTAEYTWRLLLS